MESAETFVSPLRYPGGKSRIAPFLADVLYFNNLEGCTFYEMYAGGAGAALHLLLNDVVNNIVLNDLDPHIYIFWKAILEHTDDFISMINNTAVNLSVWEEQKNVYMNINEFSELEIGFSTFFLNRCNRSGILYKAGPIGGKLQNGNYKMDVRFNKLELSRRIERIAKKKDKITLLNTESISLLETIYKNSGQNFIFLDPPYFVQGENLYLSFYKTDDHQKLRDILRVNQDKNWLLTYDNCDDIIDLYSDFNKYQLPMTYTLQSKKQSKEVMIIPNKINLPKRLRMGRKFLPLNFVIPQDGRNNI